MDHHHNRKRNANKLASTTEGTAMQPVKQYALHSSITALFTTALDQNINPDANRESEISPLKDIAAHRGVEEQDESEFNSCGQKYDEVKKFPGNSVIN